MRTRYVVSLALAATIAGASLAASQAGRGSSAGSGQADEIRMPQGNVEHGRYLAERVAMCVECHSERDGQGKILESGKFIGGNIPFVPPSDWATRVPRNRGLPGYTDTMAMRLLTQGSIGRDGRPLKPPMPRFRMTPQDAADVIAYLRSL